MTIKEDLERWREDNEGVSFAEWRERHGSPVIDNTIEPQHNTSRPINSSPPEPKFIIKKNWKEHHVAKNIYLSRWVFDKLKNETTISGKVNKILMDYFSKEYPKESQDDQDNNGGIE